MKLHHYLLNKDWEPTIVYPELMKEWREKDYKTLWGQPLVAEAEPAKTEELVKVEAPTNDSLEKATEDYKLVYGKAVPPNKKNDLERIRAKVNETLTPEK